jgi:hypothetical protein
MEHGCDVAVAGSIGIGSLVCYTRLVEEFARRAGRPIRLLTVPLDCSYDGRRSEGETDYPLWEENPYIESIADANALDPAISDRLSSEMDNFCQARHEIQNLCAPYGLRPRALRGSLFLSSTEKQWALEELAHLKRPLICLCPYGRSSSGPGSPWYVDRWQELVEKLDGTAGLFQVGNENFMQKPLPVFTPVTTIRKIIALIWASDLYIGFDTGPTHIATALEKPAIVLWDAIRKAPLEEAKQAGFSIAHMNRWAYPQNNNLVILGEKNREVLDWCVERAHEVLSALEPSIWSRPDGRRYRA